MTDPQYAGDVLSRRCPSRETMQDITSRWGVLALAALHDGPHRFGELRRRVDGVSERMLAQTLQRLERDGLVARTVLTQIPPAVEYTLTDLGRATAAPLVALIGVVEHRIHEVMTARAEYDRRTAGAG